MTHLGLATVPETRAERLGDATYVGACPGLIAALQTWSQTRVWPPQRPCWVTGGGLTEAGPWRPGRNGVLRPVRVVMALLRGTRLAAIDPAIRAGPLSVPTSLTLRPWETRRHTRGRRQGQGHIRERSPPGTGVLTSRARSSRGGPRAKQRWGIWPPRGGDVPLSGQRGSRRPEGPGPAHLAPRRVHPARSLARAGTGDPGGPMRRAVRSDHAGGVGGLAGRNWARGRWSSRRGSPGRRMARIVGTPILNAVPCVVAVSCAGTSSCRPGSLRRARCPGRWSHEPRRWPGWEAEAGEVWSAPPSPGTPGTSQAAHTREGARGGAPSPSCRDRAACVGGVLLTCEVRIHSLARGSASMKLPYGTESRVSPTAFLCRLRATKTLLR